MVSYLEVIVKKKMRELDLDSLKVIAQALRLSDVEFGPLLDMLNMARARGHAATEAALLEEFERLLRVSCPDEEFLNELLDIALSRPFEDLPSDLLMELAETLAELEPGFVDLATIRGKRKGD